MRRLIQRVSETFRLDINGIHGLPHWRRVRENGLLLANETGADVHVVELFAYLHDSCRKNDGDDPEHGHRAARMAHKLRGKFFDATDLQMEMLAYACMFHADGYTSLDPTIGTCWDADRLDLFRVYMEPSERFLSTTAAKQHLKGLQWNRSNTTESYFAESVEQES